ncbi:MAG: tryptophan 7-halogenase [Pseudomonadota bacterium]|nr:tryptophan 7-halogenase [Pseudomonadota bacterium]
MGNTGSHPISDEPSGVCDVLIVGAGPAGSATGLMLARLLETSTTMRRVVMVETSRFDAFRIGESLPPDTRVLLDRLGVLPAFLAAGHQPCWGSISSWGADELGFNDFAVNIHGHGWHVERTRFDALLAEQAAARGVELHQGWRLRAAEALPEGGYRVDLRDNEQRECSLSARWVVDASGQAGIFAHEMGARRVYDDRLISIAGVFELRDSTLIDQRTLLEAVPYGWWYCARLNAHQAIVSITTDSGTARLRALASIGSWFGHLAQTRHLGDRLHSSTVTAEGLRPWAAPSFRLDPCVGKDWLAVGDSAISYDPITAQGIHKALEMGIAAAHAIEQRLSGAIADFSGYERSIEERHAAYLDLRRLLYAREQRWPEQPFWKARQKPMVPQPRPTVTPASIIRSNYRPG